MTQTLPATAVPTAPAATRNLSVVALVLGISSVLLGLTFLVPIAAIVVGILAYRREPEGHAFAVWGIVLGAVMAFGWFVTAVVGIVFAGPWLLVGLF